MLKSCRQYNDQYGNKCSVTSYLTEDTSWLMSKEENSLKSHEQLHVLESVCHRFHKWTNSATWKSTQQAKHPTYLTFSAAPEMTTQT